MNTRSNRLCQPTQSSNIDYLEIVNRYTDTSLGNVPNTIQATTKEYIQESSSTVPDNTDIISIGHLSLIPPTKIANTQKITHTECAQLNSHNISDNDDTFSIGHLTLVPEIQLQNRPYSNSRTVDLPDSNIL
jgi:hypothetical protein